MSKTAEIDSFLRKYKVDGKTKITLSLLIELLDEWEAYRSQSACDEDVEKAALSVSARFKNLCLQNLKDGKAPKGITEENISYEAHGVYLGYREAYKSASPRSQDGCAFVEWVNENRYSKYWGSDEPNCGKWYVQYSRPDREYFTTQQLYELFKDAQKKGDSKLFHCRDEDNGRERCKDRCKECQVYY